MNMLKLIHDKKHGFAHSDEEIRYIVEGYTNDEIPDYQMSAWLMAVYFKGLSADETKSLTKYMIESGDVLDLSSINGITADKHSTGGVGDKTTLVFAPIAAAAGIKISKMSGRSLGFTGGTIDKLESIEGFNVNLGMDEFINQVNECGIAVMCQAGGVARCDKKLYALRDVTETVDSIPLIASSVMSKKIAVGAQYLILDVKTGAGAFAKTDEEATELAKTMVEIGSGFGIKIAAFVTDMSTPLGRAIGNSVEVMEAIETLRGNGAGDLTELVTELNAYLFALCGRTESVEAGRELVRALISSGAALGKLSEMIERQHGSTECILKPEILLDSDNLHEIYADRSGFISEIAPESLAVILTELGAGRLKKTDVINHKVGLILEKKNGEHINKGDVIARLVIPEERLGELEEVTGRILNTFTITEKAPPVGKLIKAVVTESGVTKY